MRKLKTAELNRLSTDAFKSADKFPILVVLEDVRSAMNIGSVFRTSDAFRIEAIYLTGISAIPPHRDILKSALGATDTVDWKYFETTEDCLKELKQQDYQVIAVEQSDSSVLLNDFIPEITTKYALVLGNEVDGVSDVVLQQCATCLEIPQYGMKHSLNVSVAAGIVLWDLVCKLQKQQ